MDKLSDAAHGRANFKDAHPDLQEVKLAVFDPLGLTCSALHPDSENAEYGALSFLLGSLAIKSRVAKTTPKKVGLFVTVWTRAPDGSTQPFSKDSGIDLLTICVRQDAHFGQFVFPLNALIKHGIVTDAGREGKRGFRVYPPWVATDNDRARRTQRWQTNYFLNLDSGNVDLSLARTLFGVSP
jgi:hypothetical protein